MRQLVPRLCRLVIGLGAGAAFALAIPASYAQTSTPVPDTTSAWRYYPLAIGDVWEYQGSGMSPGSFRIRIVGDTLVGSTHYFKRLWEGIHLGKIWSQDEILVRFDTALATPRFALPDGTGVEWGLGMGCPLDAAFESSAECLYSRHRVTGRPDTLAQLANETLIQDVALKQFWGSGGVREEYVSGIGLISDFLVLEPGGKQMVYARVGGIEYGTSRLAVDTEPSIRQLEAITIQVLGNPARERIAFQVQTPPARAARWTVTDALGRILRSAPLDLASGTVEVATHELATGVYQFTVSGVDLSATVSFTVAR